MENKKVKVTIKFENSMLTRLKSVSKRNRRSSNEQIEIFVLEYIKEFEKENGEIK